MKFRGAVLLAAACALGAPAGGAEPLPVAAQRILDARFAGWAVESRSFGPLRAGGARELSVVRAGDAHDLSVARAGDAHDLSVARAGDAHDLSVARAGDAHDLSVARAGDAHELSVARAGDAHDLSVVLVRPDAPQTHAVAVLLEDGHGGWRFSSSSSAIDVDAHGEALAAEIRAGTLTVRTTAPGGEVAVVTSWRFAFRAQDRVLRLVGLDVERMASGDAAHRWRDLVRTDLLTGARHETMDDVVRGHARHRQHETRLPLRQPILFEEFAFDTRGLAAEAEPRLQPPQEGR